MGPLEEILDKAIEEEKEIGISFVYSPFERKTFTAIEEYISKCSNLKNYNKLPIYIHENTSIDGKGKTKEVTTLEAKIFCRKKRIKFSEKFVFYKNFKLEKFESPEDEIGIDIDDYDVSIEDYKIDECDLVKNGKLKVKKEYEGARIYIFDLSKDKWFFRPKVDDNNYIIAGDISNVKKDEVNEKMNSFFVKLKLNKNNISLHSREMKLKMF